MAMMTVIAVARVCPEGARPEPSAALKGSMRMPAGACA